MWATWCPPCRSTLEWLNSFQRAHASDVAVVALAVDSKLEDVRQSMGALKPAYHVVFATPDIVQAFGAAAAVPKLVVFDPTGARKQVIYGAPPNLHQQIEAAVGRKPPA